jgi:hypothetical protein
MRANRQASSKSARASSMAKWTIVALALAFSIPAALAAGPFDGQWTGGSPGFAKSLSDKCSHSLDITVTVADGVVSGQAVGGVGTYSISGKVGPDGSFTGTLAGAALTGNFSGNTFDGSFHTGAQPCLVRSVNLHRG